MKPENKQFLDDHRHHYDTYVRAQYIQQFDGATKNGLLKVIHEEFNAGYPDPTYCSICVAEMLVYCYKQYDKWIMENNRKDIPEQIPETIEDTNPNLDGAILKTTFPLHDKPKTKPRKRRKKK